MNSYSVIVRTTTWTRCIYIYGVPLVPFRAFRGKSNLTLFPHEISIPTQTPHQGYVLPVNYYCSSPPTDLNINNNVDGTEEMNLSGLRCLFIWHHQEKNVFRMAFWKNITYCCLGGWLSKSIQKCHANSTASGFSSQMQQVCAACHAHFFFCTKPHYAN